MSGQKTIGKDISSFFFAIVLSNPNFCVLFEFFLLPPIFDPILDCLEQNVWNDM